MSNTDAERWKTTHLTENDIDCIHRVEALRTMNGDMLISKEQQEKFYLSDAAMEFADQPDGGIYYLLLHLEGYVKRDTADEKE